MKAWLIRRLAHVFLDRDDLSIARPAPAGSHHLLDRISRPVDQQLYIAGAAIAHPP
jgi:hypothetical protein